MFNSSILQGIKDSHNKLKIIDAIHVRPKKIGERKYTDEILYIIYRDTTTGEKKLATIVKPEVDIWFVKPEHREAWKRQRSYLPETKCFSEAVPYNKRTRRIIQEINAHDPNGRLMRMINAAYANGEYRALNEVYKWRYSMYSDFKLDDHAIMMWNLEMKPEIMGLAKSYLDIESDMMKIHNGKVHIITNEEHKNGEAPINACTVIFDHKPGGVEREYNVHTFLLRDHKKYPQQPEFEANIDKFIEQCHEEFDERYHKAKYDIKIFNSEKAMLAAIFQCIHRYKPDINLMWNMGYEVPQFSMRMRHMGHKPEEFFSHPDFNKGLLFFYMDSEEREKAKGLDKKFNDIANKTIYLNDTSYTKWMDQMVNYAAFRKGGHDYGGNSLDNVGYIELKEQKREFEGRNVNVLNAAHYEYWNFALYNINDVWLQVGIDEKTKDTDKVYGISMDSSMSMNKAHKTTHLLINNITRNLFRFPEVQGDPEAPRFIIGNNLNGF